LDLLCSCRRRSTGHNIKSPAKRHTKSHTAVRRSWANGPSRARTATWKDTGTRPTQAKMTHPHARTYTYARTRAHLIEGSQVNAGIADAHHRRRAVHQAQLAPSQTTLQRARRQGVRKATRTCLATDGAAKVSAKGLPN
jgi:hypothetical protein